MIGKEIINETKLEENGLLTEIPPSLLAKNISGGKFVHKYHLSSPISVVSAVKGLLEKDFITRNDNVYSIYDRFFQLWLETGRG